MRRIFLAAFFVIVFFGLVMQIDNPLRGIMRAGVRNVAAVAWTAVSGMSDAIDRAGGLSTRASLAAANSSLRQEVSRLESLSLQNDVLRSENETLRNMLGLRAAHPLGQAAPVLANPSVSPYGTFIVGSGTSEGVAVNSYVLTEPRVAIGRITEVDAHTALVELYSAPDKEIEVMINGVRATYAGRGDGNGVVVVPRAAKIAVGDAVQLPGKEFAIGFVGDIESKPQDANATLLIRVPANLPSLSFVYIIPGN